MRLNQPFFLRSALEVAPDLAGKLLVRHTQQGILRLRITETEAYMGESDTACHAHKGRTPRTEIMYMPGGTMYVYLCYGMHWLINIVTGPAEQPQCVLIRACEKPFDGPAKLTKHLEIDKRFNGLNICDHPLIYLEDDGACFPIRQLPRVGIDYAAQEDRNRPWRFAIQQLPNR